ncbi:MAG: FAD:protein FMN transferase [Candidatus Cloacimonadaceae bacterium]|jgi:thiamine biosynthesis lipoprotein|nr:FAD:protein FMN transferase [Candidatus Cloacimonadota bacterium]MDY0126846.1 FAD:protein FMN transferase [Candidatus Cloacimonadaceae bacterium]MCB5255088.1 FAD:protein FMN transferase [Candidatus Cloacimonadota bacterium]MCK9177621.1 FAD:protein FMN transferase [Candidatus Cloacimonadota bacterium]MCK9242483.1 FAD:protein FMN transferase [Candidatus Cloacimonadota bacterium]
MNRKEIFSLIILIVVVSFGAYQYFTREYPEIRSKYILDTIVEISATSKSKNVGSDIEKTFKLIQDLETKLNEYSSDSMITQINSSSEEHFDMDPDLYELLVIADSLWQMTDGAFDPTIKPVWDLWGFGTEEPAIPDSLLIKAELNKVDFSRIKYDKKQLYKPQGMQITFGALAKGYILDKALDYMKQRGLLRGFVNSRSSMTFFGYNISPLVYIQHPRKDDDSIASFKANNLSIGTSGDYQQFFEDGGQRYHHILDAHNGLPVRNIFSVSVVTEKAAWADGLSTALFTMDPQQALQLVRELPNTNTVIYYQQDDAIFSLKTEGMKSLNFNENL